jgi:nondiscriminating glutamyl-tRNA synthetase
MNQIRVRFAPSPTGYVHIGSLRTALYNYLFARKNNGACILRIEDTDQNRFVEGAIEDLLATMKWAGIEFDESIEKKGELGPYQQSKRLDIYKEHVQWLLDEEKAYPCFATSEELEKMRQEQMARGQDPRYDGRYRDLPLDEAKVRMKSEPYVVRMKVPLHGETVVNDIVRGQVVFQNDVLDDQVILKSDGFPTYHLANVVDDHLMQISHVIRGEEWLPSTPKHVLLYQAFGWELAQFAHLPLLLNPDRSKLSKRQGDVAVEDYRGKGYLPEALVNFVALLGWSAGEGDQEMFAMEELIEAFSLEKVNKAGAVFDIAKLNWMNGQYIRNLTELQAIDYFKPFLEKEGVDISDTRKTSNIIQAVQNRVEKAEDIESLVTIFVKDTIDIKEEEALEILQGDTARTVLSALLKKIQSLDSLDAQSFQPLMKEIQKEKEIKGPLLWKPVRVALTGAVSGPDLPLVIDAFGKDKVIQTLDHVIANYTN